MQAQRLRPKRPILRSMLAAQNPQRWHSAPWDPGGGVHCRNTGPNHGPQCQWDTVENGRCYRYTFTDNIFTATKHELTCPSPTAIPGHSAPTQPGTQRGPGPGATHAPPNAKWYAATYFDASPTNAPHGGPSSGFPYVKITGNGGGILRQRSGGPGKIVTIWSTRQDPNAPQGQVQALVTDAAPYGVSTQTAPYAIPGG